MNRKVTQEYLFELFFAQYRGRRILSNRQVEHYNHGMQYTISIFNESNPLL